MTIYVPEYRTMIIERFAGVSLEPGEHDRDPVIEEAFVKAGFAHYVMEEKQHITPENKMVEPEENKEPRQKRKYTKRKNKEA